jgi:hypothetical protein
MIRINDARRHFNYRQTKGPRGTVPAGLKVARIAARGQKQCPRLLAALFMSRNGEAHLTRVYCTLRMRSHTKLARILLANAITD